MRFRLDKAEEAVITAPRFVTENGKAPPLEGSFVTTGIGPYLG
jgi:hypothetical protein